MTKQTAVEFLEEIYLTTGIDRNFHFAKAKEMEKEQKREMFVCGGQYQLTGGGIFTQVHEELYGGKNDN